jgi:hypothetical protein
VRDARQAIDGAREAQRRIDHAQRDIAAAQAAQTAASVRADAANHRIAVARRATTTSASASAPTSGVPPRRRVPARPPRDRLRGQPHGRQGAPPATVGEPVSAAAHR